MTAERQTLYAVAPETASAQHCGTAPARTVLVLSFEDDQSFETTVMREIFCQAEHHAGPAAYNVTVVPVRQKEAYPIAPEERLSAFGIPARIDTLFVVGAADGEISTSEQEFRQSNRLRNLCSRSRRIVAIAGGTQMLAAMGLLDGRKAVVHWSVQEHFRLRFPRVLLQSDILFTMDRNVSTCAGGFSTADLALRLIEEDLGQEVAAAVARQLLLPFRRTGQCNQVSLTLQAQTAACDSIFRLLAWLPDHLSGDLSVKALARRTAMSTRNFARIFRQQVGVPPAKYIEGLRLEAARRELADRGQTVSRAAEVVGLANTETLRRLFLRHLGMTPAKFRSGFASASSSLSEPPSKSMPSREISHEGTEYAMSLPEAELQIAAA